MRKLRRSVMIIESFAHGPYPFSKSPWSTNEKITHDNRHKDENGKSLLSNLPDKKENDDCPKDNGSVVELMASQKQLPVPSETVQLLNITAAIYILIKLCHCIMESCSCFDAEWLCSILSIDRLSLTQCYFQFWLSSNRPIDFQPIFTLEVECRLLSCHRG